MLAPKPQMQRSTTWSPSHLCNYQGSAPARIAAKTSFFFFFFFFPVYPASAWFRKISTVRLLAEPQIRCHIALPKKERKKKIKCGEDNARQKQLDGQNTASAIFTCNNYNTTLLKPCKQICMEEKKKRERERDPLLRSDPWRGRCACGAVHSVLCMFIYLGTYGTTLANTSWVGLEACGPWRGEAPARFVLPSLLGPPTRPLID